MPNALHKWMSILYKLPQFLCLEEFWKYYQNILENHVPLLSQNYVFFFFLSLTNGRILFVSLWIADNFLNYGFGNLHRTLGNKS